MGIRIAIIGAGGIFRQRHLPGLRQHDDAILRAVCNRTEASGRAVAEAWGIEQVGADWRELIERDDVDAVMIGTWPYRHCEMSIAALEAGKHVFCQARMCMNWEEANAMAEAARRHPEQVAMLCPPPHRMPWEPAIKRMIDDGRLGEIYAVQVLCLDDSCANGLNWRQRAEYSGLQAMQVGIWAETLNAWVGECEALAAAVAIPIQTKPDDDGKPYAIRIPQIIAVSGTLAGGAVLVEHHSGVCQHEAINRATIFGSRGTLRIDAMKQIQFGRENEPLRPLDIPVDQQWRWDVETQFLDAVRSALRGETWGVSPDFTEGLRYMRKVQAIHDSAASGQAIDLPDTYPISEAN